MGMTKEEVCVELYRRAINHCLELSKGDIVWSADMAGVSVVVAVTPAPELEQRNGPGSMIDVLGLESLWQHLKAGLTLGRRLAGDRLTGNQDLATVGNVVEVSVAKLIMDNTLGEY